MYYHYGNCASGSSWLIELGMIVIGSAILVAIIVIIAKMIGNGSSSAEVEEITSDNTLAIIKERYAKGEIKRDEYEQLKKDLSD